MFVESTFERDNCKKCQQTCLTCNDANTCASCSETEDHREIQRSKCVPVEGYYENNERVAAKCSEAMDHCFACTSATVCTQCEVGFYFNSSRNECVPCDETMRNCSACTSSTVCTQCDEGLFFDSAQNNCELCSVAISNCTVCVSGSECSECELTFFLNAQKTCTLCNEAIPSCVVCESGSVCNVCEDNFFISEDVCLHCSQLTDGCLTCVDNGTAECTSCNETTHEFNETTQLCDLLPPCLDEKCKKCKNVAVCEQCEYGYQVNSLNVTECVSICGDGYKTEEEQCDDNNIHDKDGCSDECEVEKDFVCDMDPINTTMSVCHFVGQVQLTPTLVTKDEKENKIEVKFTISPDDLRVWKELDFKDIISLSEPAEIEDFQVTMNDDGTYTLHINYSGNVQGKNLTLEIDPEKSNETVFALTPPSTHEFPIVPQNNLLASNFSSE